MFSTMGSSATLVFRALLACWESKKAVAVGILLGAGIVGLCWWSSAHREQVLHFKYGTYSRTSICPQLPLYFVAADRKIYCGSVPFDLSAQGTVRIFQDYRDHVFLIKKDASSRGLSFGGSYPVVLMHGGWDEPRNNGLYPTNIGGNKDGLLQVGAYKVGVFFDEPNNCVAVYTDAPQGFGQPTVNGKLPILNFEQPVSTLP